jgi:hypothetical protein
LGYDAYGPQAELPPSYTVSGAWAVSENWHINATLGSPPDVKPRTSLLLKDMFEHLEEFKNFSGGMPVQQRTELVCSADPAEVFPSDSASNLSSHSDSTAASPKGPKTLSPKQLQAALAKLSRRLA